MVLLSLQWGRFNCPADQKVISTPLFKDMRTQIGIGGEQNQRSWRAQDQAGDFAQALWWHMRLDIIFRSILVISEQVQTCSCTRLKSSKAMLIGTPRVTV